MSIKFLLTIYICSVTTGECAQPILEQYKINQFYDTHYECVRSGLGESFELLFNGEIFDVQSINNYGLYPKFTCEKVPISGQPT